MEAKRGKKRALEAEEGPGDGEMAVKGAVGRVKAKRVSVNSEQEMVEGLARAVQPTPPVKRMGKSRAASSVLINTTRCCVLTLIHISKLTCCQFTWVLKAHPISQKNSKVPF